MSDSVICGPPIRKFNLICDTVHFLLYFQSIPTDSNKVAMLMVNTTDKNFSKNLNEK